MERAIETNFPRAVMDDKERKINETPELAIGREKYKKDLIPPTLIVRRCFAEEQKALNIASSHWRPGEDGLPCWFSLEFLTMRSGLTASCATIACADIPAARSTP
jgi:hypothetical protein